MLAHITHGLSQHTCLFALSDSSTPFFVNAQPSAILVTPTPISSPTAPTRRPTARPVAATESPTTFVPTLVPTEVQSQEPTLPPTAPPTLKPTFAPTTASPTTITLEPTVSRAPSTAPSNPPTTAPPVRNPPTRRPTTTPPSPTPSLAPSNAPLIQVVSVSALLERTFGKLQGKAVFDFESVTESFILTQLRALESRENVRFTQLEVNVYGQSIATNTRRRRLQSSGGGDLAPLQVTYNTLVVFQSPEESHPVDAWIETAFDNRTKREMYISQLQAANADAFSALQRVAVSVDGAPPTEEEENESSVWSNTTLWIIVGAVGGSLSLMVIFSTLYVMGRRRRKQDEGSSITHGRNGKHSISNETRPIPHALSYESENPEKFAAEIDCDFQTDDVSTLGDPTYYGGAMDQRTVAPPFRGRLLSDEDDDFLLLPAAESNLSKQNDIVVHTVVEPDAAARKFAVEVPPGKLGMIIDSPDANAPPVVHTIKPESILVATVQAGDWLLAVDGCDVTHCTAVQVSQLISAQSDQQRTLVFLRQAQPRERIHSTSSETNGAC